MKLIAKGNSAEIYKQNENQNTEISTLQSRMKDAENALLDKASFSYIDEAVASLVNSAPETLDTLGEVAAALEENDGVVSALNAAIGDKANKSDLDTLQTRILTQVGNANISMQNDYNTKISELATPAENGNTAYDLLIEASPNKLYLTEGTTVGDLIATVDAENQILTLNGQPTTANNNKAVSITPFTCRTGETWTFSMKLLGGEGTAGTLKLINVADGLWNNAISLSTTSLSVKKTFTADKTYDAIYYGSQNTSTTFVDFQVQFQAELSDTATDWQKPGDKFKYEDDLNNKVEKLGPGNNNRVYVAHWTGAEKGYDVISNETNPNSVVQRTDNGTMRSEDPLDDKDCATKKYVDEATKKNTTDITLTGDVTQEITPNTFYNFTDTVITSLTITFGTAQSGVLNEYMFQFIAGDGFTTLTMPSGVVWLGGTTPTITAGKTYQVSVINNLAVIGEF